MKIKLIWIGKPDGDVFDDAIRQYTAKISTYISYEMVAIPYLKNAKSMSMEEQKKREGELILKKVDSDEYVGCGTSAARRKPPCSSRSSSSSVPTRG